MPSLRWTSFRARPENYLQLTPLESQHHRNVDKTLCEMKNQIPKTRQKTLTNLTLGFMLPIINTESSELAAEM